MKRDIDLVREVLELPPDRCDPTVLRAVAVAAEQMAVNVELRAENERLRKAYEALAGRDTA